MKRRTHQPHKRRDRASGMSPYAKYGKVPYSYSTAYNAWKASIIHPNRAKEAKREEARKAVA